MDEDSVGIGCTASAGLIVAVDLDSGLVKIYHTIFIVQAGDELLSANLLRESQTVGHKAIKETGIGGVLTLNI